MSASTTFDGLMTPEEQNIVLDAYNQSKRLTDVIEGATAMGLEVPDFDALCFRRASRLRSTITVFFPSPYRAIVYGGDAGIRATISLDDSLNVDLKEWDDLHPVTHPDAADTALDVTEDDARLLGEAAGACADFLAGLQTFLQGVTGECLFGWRAALRGPDGSLYTVTDDFQDLIFRPDGRVLDLGYARIAVEDGPTTEADEIIVAKLKTFEAFSEAHE